jgi:hypothetical protein
VIGWPTFSQKKIRNESGLHYHGEECEVPSSSLSEFASVTEDDVGKIIRQSATKSCCLDPVPTQIVKQCLDILLPIITQIINLSLSSSKVPTSFKIAAVTPLLKKLNLIPEILKNFRPISNLPFLSKILEKVAAKQLITYKDINHLREIMQSAYRQFHSTETALLCVQNDLLCAIDQKQCIAMVLIDLSAAFDTVNHHILLQRLSERYGITGNAHAWLRSYLTGRKQFITIKGERSQVQDKHCDVPQGSVLGPNLYEDYTASSLGDIFRRHGVKFHIYADDTQIYLPFLPENEIVALAKLESCLIDVRQWMATNWLQLNDSKTEFIIFGSSKNLSCLKHRSIRIGECDITSDKLSVKSLGALFDINLKCDKQVTSVCKSAWYHLFQISKIRHFLTTEQVKSVIHAYVTSRIDQNNSLLLGLPKNSIKRIQCVQNASARLILGLKKYEHITPGLLSLHWLPVEYRILFKVLLLTFKCLNGQGPTYLKDLLVPYVPTRSLRSSSDNLLCTPKTHYAETLKRSFSARAPNEWNKLPRELKDCDSSNVFKSKLKNIFLGLYLM